MLKPKLGSLYSLEVVLNLEKDEGKNSIGKWQKRLLMQQEIQNHRTVWAGSITNFDVEFKNKITTRD